MYGTVDSWKFKWEVDKTKEWYSKIGVSVIRIVVERVLFSEVEVFEVGRLDGAPHFGTAGPGQLKNLSP